MHSCQPRLAFRCNRPLLQQNNLRLLLLHKNSQTHKPIFQQNHSDLIPGVEPPRNPQRKCKPTTSSSSFAKNKYLKFLLHRKRSVPTSTLEHHDQQQLLLLLQERRMQKCAEDFQVHWQSKEQNGPATSNPRNQEQHQEV